MEVKLFTKSLKPKLNFWMQPIGVPHNVLEAEINLWLASKPDIEIKKIAQTQSGGSWMPATVVVTVWYQ
ncbi:hypothetical protein [uncultured Paraglaciecola sp.]|uniref:hypothetical protein n=1 Tax=uncultured Paraglaciecola sp. TaxID=1765024 RepID=UPI00259AB5BE|nr:hypothetical protein [uncultured Paraglaciecola sp.]